MSSEPKRARLRRLAFVLGCHVGYLLGETDTPDRGLAVPERAADLMRVMGYEPADVARMAQLPEETVRAILSGTDRYPAYAPVAAIARALGCTVEYLAGEPDATLLPPRQMELGDFAEAPQDDFRRAAEHRGEYRAASAKLDASLLLRTAKAWFELLERRRRKGLREWTAAEKADGLVSVYLGLIGQGQFDDSSIKEKIDLFE